jgi:hypothetical protein
MKKNIKIQDDIMMNEKILLSGHLDSLKLITNLAKDVDIIHIIFNHKGEELVFRFSNLPFDCNLSMKLISMDGSRDIDIAPSGYTKQSEQPVQPS